MNRLLRILAAPRLTLAVLSLLVVYSGLAAWAPEKSLERVLGPRPFSAPLFLAAVLVLFLCTLSCTWLRAGRCLSLWRGDVSGASLQLRATQRCSLERFLRRQGFRGKGTTLWRNRTALWAGWLLHLALLILIVGAVIELSFHDGGAFEVAVGETVSLAEPGIVFARTPGTFSDDRLPDLRVRLVAFDAHQHQPGFAPDRRSRLQVETSRGAVRDVVLDRAAGVRVQGITLYQAMPSGVAVVLELPGGDLRAIHLRSETGDIARADLTLPGGAQARFTVEADRSFDDPRGSGPLTIRFEHNGDPASLWKGDWVEFGNTTATLVDLVRWSGFTYVRSPGIPAVFSGFAMILTACALLVFPSGVARIGSENGSALARVWLNRGSAVVASAWQRWDDGRAAAEAPDPERPPCRGQEVR